MDRGWAINVGEYCFIVFHFCYNLVSRLLRQCLMVMLVSTHVSFVAILCNYLGLLFKKININL